MLIFYDYREYSVYIFESKTPNNNLHSQNKKDKKENVKYSIRSWYFNIIFKLFVFNVEAV